jgi:hypothetical protein
LLFTGQELGDFDLEGGIVYGMSDGHVKPGGQYSDEEQREGEFCFHACGFHFERIHGYINTHFRKRQKDNTGFQELNAQREFLRDHHVTFQHTIFM